MQESLQTLFQLQVIDHEVHELERLKTSIPGKINELTGALSDANDMLKERESRLEELERDNRQHERDTETNNDQIAKYQEQLHSVKTNKEYDALQHEIQAQKLQVKAHEDGSLELMAELESLTEELDQLRIDVASQEERINEESKELKDQLAGVDEDVLVKKDERLRVQMRVEKRVLTAYDRIRKGNKGSKGGAVVPLKKGACGGCFHTMPLQQVAEIKQMKRLVICEICGRILVVDPNAEL
ncbi:MAG: hypothetical protein HOH43_08310 [Candidatus Latescibacteria bacterium]|jgi:uncharacterized protein|nr:hypothetical protein [Candidatus Latescibacterota bacterium]